MARDYVIYRAERAKLREAKRALAQPIDYPPISVKNLDGSLEPLNQNRLEILVTEACAGLKGVDASVILKESMRSLYDGVSLDDVNTALVQLLS